MFSELQVIEIDTCTCCPAALQLLSRGLFPCAPIAPTLAVSLKMLEFVCELFVRMPPNTTSWCNTLEAFLGKRSYKLTTRVSFFLLNFPAFGNGGKQDTLRRRFGNALRWYYSLVNVTDHHVKEALETARASLTSDRDPATEGTHNLSVLGTLRFIVIIQDPLLSSFVVPPVAPAPSSSPSPHPPPASPHPPQNSDNARAPPLSRPSDYLRRRCPLCFGGVKVHDDSML
jgi:hypothetical protein